MPAFRAGPVVDTPGFRLDRAGREAQELGAPEAPLFPISGRGFAANLRRYAKRAGLEGVTPHVLRHTAAKLRRETGASIEEVGRFLGHRSLHTTSIYLRQLEGETDPGWQGVAAALGMDGEEEQA